MASRSKKPFEAALLRRYRHDLENIRRKYEAEARGLGFDDAAAELRRQARAAESDYQVLSRQFRKEIGKLKKAGVLGGSVDVRRARPTASLTRELNALYDIVVGKRKAKKVSKKAAASLKQQGFRVKNNRVVVEPSFKVNRKTGEVRQARGKHIIETIRLNAGDIDNQLRDVWKSLQPGEYVTFDVYGNYSSLFANTPSGFNGMRLRLLAYNPTDIPSVGILYIPDEASATAFERQNASDKRIAQEAAKRRRRRKYNALRAQYGMKPR